MGILYKLINPNNTQMKGKINMNKFIKNQARKVLSAPYLVPVSGLFSPIYSGIGTILMFHRVVSNQEELVCEDLEITTDYLERIINYFLENNYEIVSLDKLHETLLNKIKSDKKFVVFTFDDGYIDNYTLAYPIFKKYNIPFTIYVTTSFPDKTAVLWWYSLKDLVKNNRIVNFIYNGKEYLFTTETLEEKKEVYLEIRKLILSEENLDLTKLTDHIFKKNGIDIKKYSQKLTMDWTHIKELSTDDIVTIGAHTTNHYNLKKLDAERVVKEIKDSKDKLEMVIGKKVQHFAFPFGSRNEAGSREVELVEDLGFKTVTTTRCGNVFLEHHQFTNFLPRISVSPYTESPYIELYINGFIPAIRNKLRRVIVD